MRRNLMSDGLSSSLRSGVTHSVITRKRSAQLPVMWVMCSTGLAPKIIFQEQPELQRDRDEAE